MADQINDAQPDVLWVGIGVPKQEKWMAHMRDRLDVPVMCGVGAAFDFHAGRVSMARAGCRNAASSGSTGSRRSRGGCCRATCYTNPRFVVAFARQYLAERRRV